MDDGIQVIVQKKVRKYQVHPCLLCPDQIRHVKRHVLGSHLPWYLYPCSACWTYRFQGTMVAIMGETFVVMRRMVHQPSGTSISTTGRCLSQDSLWPWLRRWILRIFICLICYLFLASLCFIFFMNFTNLSWQSCSFRNKIMMFISKFHSDILSLMLRPISRLMP